MTYHVGATVVNPPANPLIPEWPELIIGAIAFLIVFAVLGKVLLPRIQKTLAERTDAIEGGIQRAEEAQAEAQQVLERVPPAARRGPAGSGAAPRAGPGAGRPDHRGHARGGPDRGAAHHRRGARSRSRPSGMLALQALRTDVGAMAVDLASRVVGESLEDVARQRRIVERFIEDLEQPGTDGVAGRDEARSTT